MSHAACPHCQRAAANATGSCPRYDYRCVGCCARLVTSARPLRAAQEGHLAAIARHDNAPSRQQILQHIKESLHAQAKAQ